MTLPPGRLRLATRPALTGSRPNSVATMGMALVARFAANAAGSPEVTDDVDFQARKFIREFGKLVDVAARIAKFDNDVLSVDVAKIAQALLEISDAGSSTGWRVAMSEPTDPVDLWRRLRLHVKWQQNEQQ